ncbi:hypothetical protein NIES932_13160 [Raphidiopsis curvata NIES-932]|nr:hypothetical protein NIES932_13160 [Raphidiopsis curvata NIES-932]
MLGTFQQSQLRIEIEASSQAIHDSLVFPAKLREWLPFGGLPPSMPEKLTPGFDFTTSMGYVTIYHHVDVLRVNCLRLLLSGAIDGFHEWYWGEGWLQSRLEGVSLLPLNLGQTLSLLRLRHFLTLP